MNSRPIRGLAALVLCTTAIAAPTAQSMFRDYDAGGTGGGAGAAPPREPYEHGRGGSMAQQDRGPAVQATFRDRSAGGTKKKKKQRMGSMGMDLTAREKAHRM